MTNQHLDLKVIGNIEDEQVAVHSFEKLGVAHLQYGRLIITQQKYSVRIFCISCNLCSVQCYVGCPSCLCDFLICVTCSWELLACPDKLKRIQTVYFHYN